MKNALIIAFLLFSTIASATDYYVSSSGNDANNGLSPSTSWKSITKVNSAFSTIKPGDRILFNRGDTFYGTITVTKSGSAGNPITIGAYGTGDTPIITGFTTISGWTNEGNGIYSKVITSAAQTNMVTIDGVQYAMGRTPDASYLTYESLNNSTPSITDNQLTSSPDWDGAEVVIRKVQYILDRCTITDHTGTTITYSNNLGGTTSGATANFGYFIQNDLRCVTKYGEWYHNISTGKFYMYFGAVDPTTKVVKVATINNLFTFNDEYDYITVDNITFTGSINNTVHYYGNNCYIQNCTINFSGEDGIYINGNSNVINNNQIIQCNRDGVEAWGTNNTITNNLIRNIGVITGQTFDSQYTDGIQQGGGSAIIRYNIIKNTGYNGIFIRNDGVITLQYNLIDSVCLFLDDGGGIYTANSSTYKRTFDHNIILNVIGNNVGTSSSTIWSRGIYLDAISTNVEVTNNTVAHVSSGGIMLHKAHDNIIENNTLFDNHEGIYFQNSVATPTIYNNKINNNIFFAKTAAQLAIYFYSGTNDIPSFGTADSNYYARPIADNDVFYSRQPNEGYVYRTLAEWQRFTSQDANSHKSPIAIMNTNDIRFDYNASKTNKVIALSQPMIDVKGLKYVNSITLLPYTSVVLMVDPNPAQPVIPVYTGSVIENATPSLLVMTYNMALANLVPAASAFSVRVNAVSRTINTVVISGTKVQLTLASPIISGDVVTISYTKPASNPLQTASGALAANISNQTVINNCINNVPNAVITSPINNSSFTALANIMITANATDADGSISLVEFYNGSVKLGSISTAPYSFTWNNVPAGTYSLTVIATDNLNAKTTSSAISISVNNGTTSGNQPPVIIISNPQKGNKFENPATITIDAVASDPDGTISKVEFYSGSIKLVELTSAPYSYTWKDVEAGSYSITAIATDNLNANATSSPIEFEVGANIKYDADSKIINLYPNPNDGHFSIGFINPLQNERSEILITDLAGKQVYNGLVSKEETIKQIDLSYIKSGIYILMIIYKEILVTKKFIIN